MNDADTIPARLHAILAKDGKHGIVFRRGPSKRVCTFLWDRFRDSFQMGQWLKGRIYERRSDLSPDGRHMIYFAMNGKWDSETRGSWTALSRAPWLKAIELYAKGDCWDGGGLFLSNTTYWLNDRKFGNHQALLNSGSVTRDEEFQPAESCGSECTGVYYPRLVRDGWSRTADEQVGKWHSQTIFEKPLAKHWVLRKIVHGQVGPPIGKSSYWDEHALVNRESGLELAQPEWEWADWDNNALVWATGGCLFRARIESHSKIGRAKILHDFNNYSFEPIKAPY
ncbi:MAG: hypothetical protein MI755_15140 [Sphingomonadales bacterium]|nr:hypothetical protein [Sphingomonadales bacterium]